MQINDPSEGSATPEQLPPDSASPVQETSSEPSAPPSKRTENRYEPSSWGDVVYLTPQPRGTRNPPRVKATVLDESLAGMGVRLEGSEVSGLDEWFVSGQTIRVDNGEFCIRGHIKHCVKEDESIRLGLHWLPNAEYEPFSPPAGS